MNRWAAALAMSLALLAAVSCTTSETLNPAAINAPAPLPVVEPQPTAPAAPPQTAPVGAERARVTLAPVIGAPGPAIDQFSARLVARAPSKQFAVTAVNDPTATYTLKGFFSTSPEAGETVVYYVWDVADAGGNRVHRFSGEERVKGRNEGWRDVTEANMQAIADRTADEFAAWLSARAG
jgi:hypothetical protein